MNKIWIYGIVLLSLVTMVSAAVMVEKSTITNLKATYKGGDILVSGNINGLDITPTGIINAFCEHEGVIDYIGMTNYKLSNGAKGKRDTFFIRDSSICMKKDLAWVEVGDYTSKTVEITSKRHHKQVIPVIVLTPEEECELDNTKEWIEDQCVTKEIPLTPKEECELDTTMEWVNDECVLKEIPICYEQVCESIKTTCNSYNFYDSCSQVQTTCNTWNYEEQCTNNWAWTWIKDGHGTKEKCTSHNHQNCHLEWYNNKICENVSTTCNIWNYEESCERLQGDCNIWNYEEQCEQVEISCTN